MWKYIRPIFMGLGAVLEKKLDNQDRALHLCTKKLYACADANVVPRV